MYLQNPNQKIKITDKLRTLLINERTRHNYTGSVVAQKMGRQQSWIAQVESGRIQSIKHQDLVMFFSVVLDISPEEADHYLSKNLSEEFLVETVDLLTEDSNQNEIIDKESVKQLHRFSQYTDTRSEEEFLKYKEFLIDVLNIMYNESPESSLKMIKSFCVNLKTSVSITMGISSLPFYALEGLDHDTLFEIYKKLADAVMDIVMEYANKDEERIIKVKKSESSSSSEEKL